MSSSKSGCHCPQERQNRWIEPSLLLLLSEKPRHGYDLISELNSIGFLCGANDPGAIYRNLRHMELNGFVKSEWHTESGGPAKRLYHITDEGREHLNAWSMTLRQRRDAIDSFLKRIEALNLNS